MTTWTPPPHLIEAARAALDGDPPLYVAPNGRGVTDPYVHDLLDNPPAAAFCVLLNNATETPRLQRLLKASSAVCYHAGRVKYTDPDGNPAKPVQGQLIIGVGVDRERFRAAFAPFGVVWHRPTLQQPGGTDGGLLLATSTPLSREYSAKP